MVSRGKHERNHMNKKIVRKYKEFRAAGWRAQSALWAAKTVVEFEEEESAGNVRLTAEWEQEDYFRVYGEPDTEKEKEEIIRAIELNGCYCVSGSFRVFPDVPEDDRRSELWETADGVGFCIYPDPLDPIQNPYVIDVMAETLRRLDNARSDNAD
jgi:hypothetical protein